MIIQKALSYPFKVSASGFRFANTTKGKQNRSNFEKYVDSLMILLVRAHIELTFT